MLNIKFEGASEWEVDCPHMLLPMHGLYETYKPYLHLGVRYILIFNVEKLLGLSHEDDLDIRLTDEQKGLPFTEDRAVWSIGKMMLNITHE